MSYPIDLSITGKPSPRVEHPRSAGRPMNANRARSIQSDIFGTKAETSLDNRAKSGTNKSTKPTNVKSNVKFKNGESARSIVSKSELESIKKLTKTAPKEEAEQLEYGVYETSRKAAPKGVPQLSLDEITGEDDLSYTKATEKDNDPTRLDSVSWGTTFKEKKKHPNAKGGGWQTSQTRPSSVKASTSRKHEDVPDLDLRLSQSHEGLGQQLREAVKQVEDDLLVEYIGKPKKELDELKKISKEKKNQLFEEAILADQLSNLQTRPSSTTQSSAQHGSRLKRQNDMHSSSVSALGSDGDISKRLRFGARILSLNGHDARREINGFFITSDNTVALYEFRQFGTRSKALPLIQRGPYKHVSGIRKGETIHLLDITANKNLTFEIDGQSSVPDSLRKRKFVTFRITDVDEDDKKLLLFDRCRNEKEKKDTQDFIRFYFNQEENAAKEYVKTFPRAVQNALKSCGEKVMTNLHHHFQKLDLSGSGVLSKGLLREGLQKYRVNVEDEDFERVWQTFDSLGDGKMDYGDFLRAYIGDMNEERKLQVRRAFTRIDPSKHGVAELNNIRKYFCPSKHPAVLKGELNEPQVLDDFIQCFKPSRQKTEVSFAEFESYYEGVSFSMESNQSFINLLRMTWNI